MLLLRTAISRFILIFFLLEAWRERAFFLVSLVSFFLMLSVDVVFSLVLLVHYVWNTAQKDKVN